MTVPRSGGPARLACIDKPEGLTSFDVVARMRRITGCRRIGHGGTLDPFATGLLVLGIGPATRLMRFVATGGKSYEAVVRFGSETDSEDRTGTVVRECDRIPDAGEIRAALPAFTGRITQVPPRLSAVHVDGERSYRRARRGEDVEPPPREVDIESIELLDTAGCDARLRVSCGGGTYIRALARDLGRALQSAAHLVSLRRTRVGGFSLEDALTLDEFAAHWAGGGRGLEPGALAGDWPALELDEDRAARVRHGMQPDPRWWEGREWSGTEGPVALLDPDGLLVGVAEAESATSLRLAMVLPVTE